MRKGTNDMANGLYYGLNSGAVLRKLFPKQLNTQVLILIWTLVFILNIVITVVIQNAFVYPIADLTKEELAKVSYFENCKIQIIDVPLGNIRYINEEGEPRIVSFKEFPVDFIHRARVIKSSDMPMKEDGMVLYQKGTVEKEISIREYIKLYESESIFDLMSQHRGSQLLVGIYVAIGLAMLLLEFFIYSVFHRLFRE